MIPVASAAPSLRPWHNDWHRKETLATSAMAVSLENATRSTPPDHVEGWHAGGIEKASPCEDTWSSSD